MTLSKNYTSDMLHGTVASYMELLASQQSSGQTKGAMSQSGKPKTRHLFFLEDLSMASTDGVTGKILHKILHKAVMKFH